MRLDRQNKAAAAECGRLRAEFRCQEDDREYLLKRSLVVRKENEGLRAQVDFLRGHVEALLAERGAASARVLSLARAAPASCVLNHAR